MHAFDFEAVAYGGAIYCADADCLPEGITVDLEEVSSVFASAEADCYPACDSCGCEHDYMSLTSYGAELLAERTCDQCELLYINGVKCHETGCPNAWREPRECAWCGTTFKPDINGQLVCSADCGKSYFS